MNARNMQPDTENTGEDRNNEIYSLRPRQKKREQYTITQFIKQYRMSQRKTHMHIEYTHNLMHMMD